MANYLGIDGDSRLGDGLGGLYITEACYTLCCVSWFFWRLYVYPFVVLPASVLYSTQQPGCASFFGDWELGQWGLPPSRGVAWSVVDMLPCDLMRAGLLALQAMHLLWFWLLIRIGYKLLTAENAHSAGAEEYEGTSDSEDIAETAKAGPKQE
jgi:hypothetical protein